MTTPKEACRLTIGSCMEDSVSKGRLRVLIVGFGIAGATLAALLSQRGIHPAVIERADKGESEGYVLGLYPLGSRVLYGLNMHRRYRDISTKMERYVLHDPSGKILKEFPLDSINERYGDIRGVDRKLMLSLLRSGVPEENVFYNTTIQHIQNNDQNVIVTFSDGSTQMFDLVVGADGIHSEVRALLLSRNEFSYRPTGWGAWGLWRSLEGFDRSTYREVWADGWFVGLYPVQERLAVFIGGNKKMLADYTPAQYATMLQERIEAGILHSALQSLEGLEDSFFWNMEDCRSSLWSRNRVVLLGDAAAAFLPTAGIGASMAMDSAAVLADELSRTDALHLSGAINKYVARQRIKTERAQNNSRFLAFLMFKQAATTVQIRNSIVRKCSLSSLLKNIVRIMD